jgi:hypothetical protein
MELLGGGSRRNREIATTAKATTSLHSYWIIAYGKDDDKRTKTKNLH